MILRKSILKAAEDVRRAGRIQVLTEDVAQALRSLPDLEALRRHEAEEMAEGLELVCTGIQVTSSIARAEPGPRRTSLGSGSSAPPSARCCSPPRKEPGKYTEGAVVGAHFQAFVRIF